MDAKKQASLQAAWAARGRKRKQAKERNKILCNNLSLRKRRQDDKSFNDDFRRIVNFHLLIREPKNGCHYCWQRPLLLSEGILQDQRSQSPDKIQIMCRSCKRLSHVSISNSTEINEKFVLACLHTGTGHSHFDSYLNITGLPRISNQQFKHIERKVGKEIEQVAEESCKKLKIAEIEKEKTEPQQGKLKGSFNVSWRKQRGYNSLIGHGAIFGYHTKKTVLITELRTLIAKHTTNQCEWVNQQMSTIVVRTTAEVLYYGGLSFRGAF